MGVVAERTAAGRRVSAGALAGAAAIAAIALGGCGPRDAGPSGAAGPPADPEWTVLFDGQDAGRWRVLQGSVTVHRGAMVLDGREGDATILAPDVDLRNGTVEMEVRRADSARDAGPYTVALRLAQRLAWRSIYFVCRPETLQACRGSWRDPWPSPDHNVPVEKTDRTELWRFVLDEGLIHCYRFGKRVLSYADADPCAGAIAMTASRCRIEVLRIRYQSGGARR